MTSPTEAYAVIQRRRREHTRFVRIVAVFETEEDADELCEKMNEETEDPEIVFGVYGTDYYPKDEAW